MNFLNIAGRKYALLTGTSMAAPHVSGVAALVWAANPSLSGEQVKNFIVETANIPVKGKDAGGYSHNMVNAAYAVSKALDLSYAISGECGDSLTWCLDVDGNLSIDGSGEMSWESSYAPWYRYREMINSIKLGNEVTSICDEAFRDCYKTTTVELGTKISTIGFFAFSKMASLHSVKIPDNVQEINEQAFGYEADGPMDGFTIYGYSGTAAETYANDNHFTFIDLDSNGSDDPVDPVIAPSISGVVRDAEGQALEGVEINVYGADGDSALYTVKTDSKGSFSIKVDDAGSYNLKFDKEGFDTLVKDGVNISSDTNIGTITLNKSSVEPPLSEGDGTEENPFCITSAEQLQNIAGNLSAHYILKNDIDCSTVENWTPIGSEYNPFTGCLDGSDYTISNLSIKDGVIGGLFGCNTGKIENINLSNVNIVARNECGGICAISVNGVISNCHVISGSIQSDKLAGGIVGWGKNGNICFCSNGSDVLSSGNTGGIVGVIGADRDYDFDVDQCYNTGDVKSVNGENDVCAGGIAGHAFGTWPWPSAITNCYNTGDIFASFKGPFGRFRGVGGICGGTGTYDYVIRCFNLGQISGEGGVSMLNNVWYGSVLGDNGDSKYCFALNTTVTEYDSYFIELNDDSLTALTIDQFKNKESFKEFDFDKIWGYDESIPHPILINNPEK